MQTERLSFNEVAIRVSLIILKGCDLFFHSCFARISGNPEWEQEDGVEEKNMTRKSKVAESKQKIR